MNLYTDPVGQLADGRYGKYIQLNARDVDVNNRWKLSSVFEAFQEIAGDQCANWGFGWQDLMTQYGYCFIIVRMHIEMDTYPGSGVPLRIETWPENKLRLVFTRYFRVIDQTGRVIGRAVSQWVLFDRKNRAVVKPQSCPIIQMQDTSTLESPAVMPRRGGNALETGETTQSLRVPAYSDFDYNRHVNNARYIEWVMDALPAAFYGQQIRTLDIHYEHEVAYPDRTPIAMTCTVSQTEGAFRVQGVHGDETPCFTADGTFA